MSGSSGNQDTGKHDETSNPSKKEKIITIIFGVVAVAVVGVLIWWGIKPDTPQEEEPAPSPSISEPATEKPSPSKTDDAPEPDSEHQPPPEENDGAMDKPRYVDGVMYSQTEKGVKEWEPVRRKFLQAFTSSDEIAPQVKDITDDETQKKLKREKPGAYADMEIAVGDDEDDWYRDEDVRPFSFTQIFTTTSKSHLYVSMEYIFDGEKGEWQVTGYEVK